MPTYDYRCEACGHELEVFQNISEAPKRKCPACKKSKLKRKIGGGAGFLFKGSGFYLTDYRSDSYKKGAQAEQKPGENGASAPSSGADAAAKKPETSAPPPAAKDGKSGKSAKEKKEKRTKE
jgi:putative FmdB family regulatory protein